MRFVCCERKDKASNLEVDEPWGRSFWCVAIERVDDDLEEEEGDGDDRHNVGSVTDSDMLSGIDKDTDDID
jgi:hypothetical protein